MKLKIISDGTVHGTKIVNAETGETVEGIVSVDWGIDVHDSLRVARASLEVINVPVELIADADVFVPLLKQANA